MARVLIIEDEVSLAKAMGDALSQAGHEIQLVHIGEKVLETFRAFQGQILIIDIRLGGMNGLELFDRIKAESPEVEGIVVTAYGSVELAVEAMKRGAAEFLTKPVDLDVLTVAVDKVWSASEARRRLQQFRSAQAGQLRQVQLIGQCDAIDSIREHVARLTERTAAAEGDLPPILLTGETGTGKDLLATYIHAAMPHRSGPFVAVNCSAIPVELFESELFGHQRGAFSGAAKDKPGLIETADGGTLFLDEISDLPANVQPKLLRALESHLLRRVGDTRDRSFDVCLIAATNRDLYTEVSKGRFREDLYYRLNVIAMHLPPLRERGDDITLLAQRFCDQLASKYGLTELRLSGEVVSALRSYHWPGNVRELKHALESAALVTSGLEIVLADLPLPRKQDPVQQAELAMDRGQPISLEEVERSLIERALAKTEGNVSAAARLLSISREAMRYRMNKFDLGSEGGDAGSAPES